jgi:DNA-binding transcriptional ArsR family regulator
VIAQIMGVKVAGLSTLPVVADGAPSVLAGAVAVAEARADLLADSAYLEIAETFRALADSTRARIVHLLANRALCVSDLAQLVGVSEPAVSQHLRLLRSLRIVRGRREGKMVFYTLQDAHVRALLAMALSHRAENEPSDMAAAAWIEEVTE